MSAYYYCQTEVRSVSDDLQGGVAVFDSTSQVKFRAASKLEVGVDAGCTSDRHQKGVRIVHLSGCQMGVRWVSDACIIQTSLC